MKKNAFFGAQDQAGKTSYPVNPAPIVKYRKANEVEMSIVFCGHEPSADTEVSWSHAMQKVCQTGCFAPTPTGAKL